MKSAFWRSGVLPSLKMITPAAPLTFNAAHDEGPAWSPDGRLLAFTSGPDNLHGDIHVMTDRGRVLRRLTDFDGRDESPDWQPIPAPRTDRRCGDVSHGGALARDVGPRDGACPAAGPGRSRAAGSAPARPRASAAGARTRPTSAARCACCSPAGAAPTTTTSRIAAGGSSPSCWNRARPRKGVRRAYASTLRAAAAMRSSLGSATDSRFFA